MRSIPLRFIAGALVVPIGLQAQTESFGSLQFSMPKAVREQTADFVSVTDSSKNAVRALDAWFEAVKNGRVLVLDNTRLGKAR